MTVIPDNAQRSATQETRNRIFAAAENEFAAHGFSGATMRQIAAAANVNKFMLYYHFTSKEALYLRVLESTFQPIFRQLAKIVVRRDALDKTIGDIFDMFATLFVISDGHLRPFLAQEIAIGAPYLGPMFAAIVPDMRTQWRLKIQSYMGTGLLSERRLEQFVYSILTSLIAPFLMQPVLDSDIASGGQGPVSQEHREHAVDYILGGLRLNVLAGD